MESTIVHRVSVAFLSIIGILPILMLPGVSMDADTQKGIVSAFVVGVTLVAIGLMLLISKRSTDFAPSILFAAGVPLVVVAAISTLFSPTRLFAGAAFEPVTCGSLALVAITLALCACVPRSWVRYIVLISASAVALFLLVSLGLSTSSSAPESAPSSRVTQIVLASAYLEDFRQSLLGTSEPYSYAWQKYQPVEVNVSPFWSDTPADPGSTAVAVAIRWGLLGFLALLLLPAASLISTATIFRREQIPYEVAAICAYTLLLLGYVFVASADTSLLLAAAIAIGCTVRISYRGETAHLSRRLRMAAGAAALCFGVILVIAAGRQFVAAEFFARAMESGIQPETKIQYLELATRAWGYAPYSVEASKAIYEHGFAALPQTEQNREALLEALRRATQHADSARGLGYRDLNSLLYVASIYIARMPLGIPSDSDQANAAIVQALQIAPNRPEPRYVRALHFLALGDTAGAMTALYSALSLKPDYEEARVLLEQLTERQPQSETEEKVDDEVRSE